MKTRTLRILMAALGLGLSGFLGGCQTTDPPPADTVLWLKLNDSLSRYDLVVVQILDRQTKDVLATLWNAPLPAPATNIPGHSLKSIPSMSFIVKVSGYLGLGQLALETLITYEGGQKSVLHNTDLPPVRPVNGLLKLAPSAGATISPAFSKDSLNYVVTLPSGSDAVTLSITAENPAATITVDGEAVASGGTSKLLTVVGTTPDTVKVIVTDKSTGVAVPRTYTVVLFPTLPVGLYLASIVPSVGALFPVFDPETQEYTVRIPANIDTISFVLSPADTRTMTMTINNKAIFPGAKSEIFKVNPISTLPIPIVVQRADKTSFYQVTVTH